MRKAVTVIYTLAMLALAAVAATRSPMHGAMVLLAVLTGFMVVRHILYVTNEPNA